MPRAAPMLIWLDEQRLPWSEEERAMLAADAGTRWLTEPFPGGAHGRPDGGGAATTLLVLFNYENTPADVVFPLPERRRTTARSRCAACRPWCRRCKAYVDAASRPYVDGGYYIKTRENRPLIGPTAVEGVYVSCAFSGFGIMASCAGGDLIARHVIGDALPAYAPAFLLARYEDPGLPCLARHLGRRRPDLTARRRCQPLTYQAACCFTQAT